MARVVASIEARMGSSRLPGKVLADVCGQPALSRLVIRLRRAKRVDDIVLATTTEPADDVLESWAEQVGVRCFRGSEEDVLARVVQAHESLKSDVIVEITGDCILLDPEIVDMGVDSYFANQCDVVTNVTPATFPMGIDVQVFSLALLQEVERTINDLAVREHVSLYFYEHPEIYRIVNLCAPPRWSGPDLRFQLDYPEDYQFICKVYKMLEPDFGPAFGVEEVMQLLRKHPELAQLNKHCLEKSAR